MSYLLLWIKVLIWQYHLFTLQCSAEKYNVQEKTFYWKVLAEKKYLHDLKELFHSPQNNPIVLFQNTGTVCSTNSVCLSWTLIKDYSGKMRWQNVKQIKSQWQLREKSLHKIFSFISIMFKIIYIWLGLNQDVCCTVGYNSAGLNDFNWVWFSVFIVCTIFTCV